MILALAPAQSFPLTRLGGHHAFGTSDWITLFSNGVEMTRSSCAYDKADDRWLQRNMVPVWNDRDTKGRKYQDQQKKRQNTGRGRANEKCEKDKL